MSKLAARSVPAANGGQWHAQTVLRAIRRVSRCMTGLFMPLLFVILLFSSRSIATELYPNGFPADVEFFPIGVWLQSPSRAPQYQAIGINTFVGLDQGPTEAQLATLTKYGMFVVTDQNATALASPKRDVIKAWLDSRDEPDNAQPIGSGLYGSCIPATEVVRRSREMKTRDPTRPVMVGFGQGVANEFWKGRGPCNDDLKYYDVAAEAADILAFDIYPVASTTPQVKGKLEYVARGVSKLVKLSGPAQKVWNVIETTALDPEHPVTPAQVRSEVWMSLIHGSSGIVYFVHEFQPNFREDAIFRHTGVVEEVSRTNKLIKSLAPVLNSPNVSEVLTVSSVVPIATMVKQYKNALYIFAVAMRDKACTVSFNAREFIVDGRAEVIGEQRSITITAGNFEDSFAGYGVHIYQISMER